MEWKEKQSLNTKTHSALQIYFKYAIPLYVEVFAAIEFSVRDLQHFLALILEKENFQIRSARGGSDHIYDST